MDKKHLTEQEIRTQYIPPAIQNAVWTRHQIREDVYLTAGRVIVRGTLALCSTKRAGSILYHKPNQPLAFIDIFRVHRDHAILAQDPSRTASSPPLGSRLPSTSAVEPIGNA